MARPTVPGRLSRLSPRDRRVIGLRHRRNFGRRAALQRGLLRPRVRSSSPWTPISRTTPRKSHAFSPSSMRIRSGVRLEAAAPGSLGKTLPSRIFNTTVRAVSGVPLHDFNCGFKIYRADVVRSIRLYGELHRFTPVLAHAEGFGSASFPSSITRVAGDVEVRVVATDQGFLDLHGDVSHRVPAATDACARCARGRGASHRRFDRSLAHCREDSHRRLHRQPPVTAPRGAARACRRSVLWPGSSRGTPGAW